jgi:hypothetical protein
MASKDAPIAPLSIKFRRVTDMRSFLFFALRFRHHG